MVFSITRRGQQGQFFLKITPLWKSFHQFMETTKAAQIHLVKTWQNECKSTGPQIYVLQPNPMPTAVRARFYPGENRKKFTIC